MSRTISITIPDKLEEELQKKANNVGISRSRFIGNILLDWQRDNSTIKPVNKCLNLSNGWCRVYQFGCEAPQHEAETCPDYAEAKED